MQYVFTSVLAFIVQNLSNKEFSRRFPCRFHGLLLFNAVALTFCAIALAVTGGAGMLSAPALLLALLFAVSFDITVMLIVVAMSMGPMGTTVLIINMSMMLPVIAGIIWWGESPNLTKLIGIACMLAVLILSAMGNKGDSKRGSVKWLIISIVTMILNGILSIQQKVFTSYCPNESAVTFSLAAFAMASLLCWVAALIFKMRGADFGPWLKKKRELSLCALGVGLGTAGGNAFNMLALTVLPAIVTFPLIQGSVVVSIWALSVFIYHDKVNLPGVLSLIAGIAGIVLLSI